MTVKSMCYFVVTAALTMACDGRATLAQSNGASETRVSRSVLRDAFVEQKGGLAKGEAALTLVTKSSLEELQLMRFDEDLGVAFSCSWKSLTIKLSSLFTGIDSGAAIVHVPEAPSREFLAFVEGRLGVPIPDKWNRLIRHARFSRSGIALFPVIMVSIEKTLHEDAENANEVTRIAEQFESGRVAYPRLVPDLGADPPRFIISGGLLPFEGSDAVIVLPPEVKKFLEDEQPSGEFKGISGIAVGERAVVAIESVNGPDRGTVFCLSVAKSKGTSAVLWRAPMDARWRVDFSGSEWFTEFRTNGRDVFLFHATHDSVGVEAFRIADGASIFSFNSRLPD